MRDRVANWPSHLKAPTEKQDWAALDGHFAPGLTREEFRLVRANETPSHWRKQGRRRPRVS
jgi:hypothetical protein